ncbi:TPA: PilZ domain-containing protein [Klebsiella pneumoniae]|nr:PilZ domain-containing protein [Klebsiella pneumoniae]
MLEGEPKRSKYEIMAILREEFRVKSRLTLSCKGMSWRSNIQKIDGLFFYSNISDPIDLNVHKNVDFKFIIYSKLGRIEFNTYQVSDGEIRLDGFWCFTIPESIYIVQRRISPRLRIQDDCQFYCTGRYKDGVRYKNILNDISEGGCSFIATNVDLSYHSKGSVLYNSTMVFGEYGNVVVNLRIVGVVEFRDDIDEEQCEIKRYRISCMFLHKNSDYKERMERVVFKLIVDNKIKNRRLFI